jgi:Putative auto-transporter adhesin, head GIN domain
MKNTIPILFYLLVITSIYAQHSNVSNKIILSNFSELKISQNINAILIPVDDTFYLQCENFDKIKYRISKGKLYLKSKNSLASNSLITVFIGVKKIDAITLNSNAKITTIKPIHSNDLAIFGNENSNCFLQTDAQNIKVTQMRESKIKIDGSYAVDQMYVNDYGDIVTQYIRVK